MSRAYVLYILIMEAGTNNDCNNVLVRGLFFADRKGFTYSYL